jgi:ferredoxin
MIHFHCSKNREAEFECSAEPQLNLLAHAQLEERFLGSQCGGHGKCGKDQIQVIEGSTALSKITDSERRLLKPEQIKDGWRLACQTWVDQPHIEIRLNCLQLEREEDR